MSKHHKEVWEAYSETRSRVATVATKAKEEEKAACEMENSEVRFYDVRSRKGRLPFLKKVNCCEMHFSFPHHQQGRIDFNTVNPSLSAGKDLLMHSL